MSDTPEYIRCRNCSRLIPAKETFGNWYCSKACALQFAQCPVCGKFFESGKGSGSYCNPDCAQIYTDENKNAQDDDPVDIKERT